MTLSMNIFLDSEQDISKVFRSNIDPLAFLVKHRNINEYIAQHGKSPISFLLEQKTRSRAKLTDLEIESLELSDEHYKKARCIKDYYSEKMAFRVLHDMHMSGFHVRLLDVLNDIHAINETRLKILMKLVDFYDEDQYVESIIENYNDYTPYPPNSDYGKGHKFDRSFTCIGSNKRNTLVKFTDFYFKDVDNGIATLRVNNNNMLLSVAKKTFVPGATANISGSGKLFDMFGLSGKRLALGISYLKDIN